MEIDYLFVSKDDFSICNLESKDFKNGEKRTWKSSRKKRKGFNPILQSKIVLLGCGIKNLCVAVENGGKKGKISVRICVCVCVCVGGGRGLDGSET